MNAWLVDNFYAPRGYVEKDVPCDGGEACRKGVYTVRPPPAEMTDDDVTKHCEKLSIPTDGVPPADLRKTLEERTWCGFRMTRCRRARVRTLEAQLATDASNLSVAELAECFPQSFE